MRLHSPPGIIALIDEATGYDKFKKKQEYQLKLQAFIADEFWYEYEVARLEGIHYSPRSTADGIYFCSVASLTIRTAFWLASKGLHSCRSAPDAHSGHRSPLSQTELEPPGAGSPDLPVPAARKDGQGPLQP
jgi:hypothetical protein